MKSPIKFLLLSILLLSGCATSPPLNNAEEISTTSDSTTAMDFAEKGTDESQEISDDEGTAVTPNATSTEAEPEAMSAETFDLSAASYDVTGAEGSRTISVQPYFKVVITDATVHATSKTLSGLEDLWMSAFFYELRSPNSLGDELPVVSSVQFVSESSLARYIDESESDEDRQARSILLADFIAQETAFNQQQSHESNVYKQLGNRAYHVSERGCRGDIYGCSLIRYSTFLKGVRIDIAIGFDESTSDQSMDALVTDVQIITL